MHRAGVWPADPLTPPPVAATLFDDPRGLPTTIPSAPAAAPIEVLSSTDGSRDGVVPHDPPTIGLWDGTADGAPEPPSLPTADVALEAGRVALHAGRRAEAAMAYGLVLRLAPGLAPAVVAALAHDRSPELALTRGDAYRLVGREADAIRTWAEALALTGAAHPGGGAPNGDATER
jgi:hypothetical protein